jgi:hypothetical protein
VLYSRVHGLIARLATAGKTEQSSLDELQSVIDAFQQELRQLSPESARHERGELCTQIEHEALVATDPQQRTILLSALKRLEALD